MLTACPWHEGLGEEEDRLTVVTSWASGLQTVLQQHVSFKLDLAPSPWRGRIQGPCAL